MHGFVTIVTICYAIATITLPGISLIVCTAVVIFIASVEYDVLTQNHRKARSFRPGRMSIKNQNPPFGKRVIVDRKTYEEQMQKAVARVLIGNRPDYWKAYQRGLMRRYHGETVVYKDEHLRWMAYLETSSTREKGEGYRDGLLG
jgi:hypothetical protein